MGHYDYYKLICVCRGCAEYVSLVNSLGHEPNSWPLPVFNVQGAVIGTATSKESYIAIWNNDGVNSAFGRIYSGFGPFLFIVRKYKCSHSDGIYESTYTKMYE